MKCNQCDSMYINGIFCHEHTCPNEHKTFINDEWIQFYECDICGYEVAEDETCSCYLEDELLSYEIIS